MQEEYFRYEDELFSKPSWIAVCLGQNLIPKSIDPIVSSLPLKQVQHSLDLHAECYEARSEEDENT